MDTHDSYKTNLPAHFSRPELPAVVPDRAPAAETARPLNVRMILRGLTRYWWQMLAIWLVASAALVSVIYLKVKPSYDAVALLEAEPAEGGLYTPMGNVENSAFLETQVNLIKSTNVLAAALLDPKAAKLSRIQQSEDPVSEIRSSLEVAVREKTYLIQVSMRSNSADEAATIVNAVVDAYIKANNLRSGEATMAKIKKLEDAKKELVAQEKESYTIWRNLAKTVADAHIPVVFAQPEKADPKGEAKAEIKKADGEAKVARSVTAKQYEDIMNLLWKVRDDVSDAEIQVNHLKSSQMVADDPKQAREQFVRNALKNDPELEKIASDLKAIKIQTDKVKGLARKHEYDPTAVHFKEKEARLRDEYDETWKARADHYRSVFEANRGAVGLNPYEDAVKRLSMLREKQQRLEKDMAMLDIKNHEEAGGAVDIHRAQADIDEIKTMKHSVVLMLEELKFKAKDGARITVADAAKASNRPSTNSRPKLLLATPVGVLAALMSLFVLLEIRSGRVGHPDELSPRMRAEVFSVPPLPTLRSSQNGRGRGDQVEEFTQRVDHLRVALCGETHTGVARCVLITSAAGGEGKTTLAAQLAGRCANAGLSTLLIDADLRRPRLGQLLDVPEGPGLSDVLSGDAEVESALVVIGNAGGFHLLPAGTPAPDPSRLLRGRRLGELLGRLRQTFDIVILDTPPVLPVPDALTMGEWVDGAVLAVRRDASRVSLVERANRMLSAKGIPLLGVVVNGVKTTDMGYGGYSGYMAYTSTRNEAYPTPSAATGPAAETSPEI